MNNKIKVMHVTGSLDVGGVDEFLIIIAKYNLDNKYDLAFAACHSSDGFAGKQIKKFGHKVYELGITIRLYDLRIVIKLMRLLLKYKPHIVHLYTKLSLLGRIAARLAGVPIIISNEMDMDWEEYGLGLSLVAHVKRRLDIFVDKAIACSGVVRTYWDKNNSDKYEVLHLPIDLEKYSTNYSDPNQAGFKNGKYPVIGMVARIHPGKGHEYLIKAMPKILEFSPTAKLKIVGTGSLMGKMKSLTTTMHLDRSVEFTGFVKDLYPELCSLDIFILPSLTEGFPLSIIEALAVGLPVAATPVGGIPEIIEPGETGLLFPPKNSEALADAVISILSDFDKAKRMGELGRQKVIKEFSPEVYMNKLDILYQELLTAKGIM